MPWANVQFLSFGAIVGIIQSAWKCTVVQALKVWIIFYNKLFVMNLHALFLSLRKLMSFEVLTNSTLIPIHIALK